MTGKRESLEFLIDCVKERIIKVISHSLGFNAPLSSKEEVKQKDGG
jgi:hypothetical protein